MEDRLGLTTVTGLLAVVTTLSLSEERSLSSLVLGDLMLGVLLARLALAVGLAGLGDVDLCISIGLATAKSDVAQLNGNSSCLRELRSPRLVWRR